MGPYTLDFYCAELKLAVEIDGGQHYDDAGRRYDQSRDEALKAMGIRTLRFSNLDVLKETEGVAEAIWGEVQRLSEREAPSPDLSPAGALTIDLISSDAWRQRRCQRLRGRWRRRL